MIRQLTLFAFLLVVASCAGLQTVSKYNYVQPVRVDVDGKCFNAYPKINEGTIYVDECPLAAAGKSFVEGLTFGTVDTTPPKDMHERAALEYLKQNNLDCEIVYPNTYYISDSLGGSYGYEIYLICNS